MCGGCTLPFELTRGPRPGCPIVICARRGRPAQSPCADVLATRLKENAPGGARVTLRVSVLREGAGVAAGAAQHGQREEDAC